MKIFRLFFFLVLLLQSLFSKATGLENPALSCPLPAPASISAVEITSGSIKVEWADVSGATYYKVERYDVTHGVSLPDAYTTEPEYTSAPHDPGTTISFNVSATSCGEEGEYGESINGEYTTSIIIVDNIVYFTIPNPTQGNVPINPEGNMVFSLTNADKNEDTVVVKRQKVKCTLKGVEYFAEFLLWSQCSNGDQSGVYVQYWNTTLWPAAVTKTENHIGGPGGPIISISFRINNQPFFTLNNSTYTQGVNGNPNIGSLTVHNDMVGPAGIIYFERSTNDEDNPCYEPPSNQIIIGGSITEESISDAALAATEDRQVIQPGASGLLLIASPNPFSNDITAHYTLEQASNVTLTLFDQLGRVQKTIDLSTLESGIYSTSIHTNDLPTGIYFLSLQTNEGHIMIKLVKN